VQNDGTQVGEIIGLRGGSATARLSAAAVREAGESERLTIGRLVGIRSERSLVVGTVVRMSAGSPDKNDVAGEMSADIDFMGEVRNYGEANSYFQRGISDYPLIGNGVHRLRSDDVGVVHRIAGAETIDVGRLRLDDTIPALINFQDLLSKHFAILGTTGVGKSSTVALVLQEILRKNAELRVLLIDPHNEYAQCFGDMAHVMSPRNLQLPFWLFNMEEAVDIIFRRRPGVEEEIDLLQQLIPAAKSRYAAKTRSDRIQVRKVAGGGSFTADTPVPYRMSDLIELIDNEVGKLENRTVRMRYHRLIRRLTSLGNDARYGFMFNNLNVQDIMVSVLGEIFRMPAAGKPITVMQLAGFPTEVVDSVVSVLCRMAFEFGLWSDGAAPILVGCEEAHRYASADNKLGFGPTKKALSRIAKEGRKYGVYLGAITQRPAELDPTILSQCSTVFAMRMANDLDKAIVKSAVPDAGAGMIDFLSSLGNREAIAFGEGVPLPTRIRFKDLPADRLPRAQLGDHLDSGPARDFGRDFMDAVVDRWRDSTTASAKPQTADAASEPDQTENLDGGTVGSSPERKSA
jgi:DNA helicase HerA-like ATPase